MAEAGYGCRGMFFSGEIRRGRDLMECINGLLREGRLRLIGKVRGETKGVALGKVEKWARDGLIMEEESRRLAVFVRAYVDESSDDMGCPPTGHPDDRSMLAEVKGAYNAMWEDPSYRHLLDELLERKYGGGTGKPEKPGPGDMLILSTAAALARRHATCLFTADHDFTVFRDVIRERLGVTVASRRDRDDWPCPRRRA